MATVEAQAQDAAQARDAAWQRDAARSRRRAAAPDPRPVGYRHGPRAKLAAVLTYTALAVTAVLFLLPFYLVLRNGLSTPSEITSPRWTIFPARPHWSNVARLFTNAAVPMGPALLNSVLVSVLQTLGTLLLAGMAGYGLARIPYRHSGRVFVAIVITLMVPTAVTFVPSFVLVSTLGWVSTLRGLIVPGLFSGLAAFLFRQYFLTFPRELEDAARVDGLSYWGIFWRIVLPNSGTFIAAIGLITFIASWNAFLWPLVIAQDQSSWTVQIALSSYLNAQAPRMDLLFIGSAISILPLVLLFVFLQRYIVRGVEQTGING
jgi:multiple sugar transport system permease protein